MSYFDNNNNILLALKYYPGPGFYSAFFKTYYGVIYLSPNPNPDPFYLGPLPDSNIEGS